MTRYVNPRTIRKRSDIVRERESNIKVSGERTPTKTGFKVPGSSQPDFETFYEVIMGGMVTDQVVHPTCSRAVRILAGRCVCTVFREERSTTVTLVPGDEILLGPGVGYTLTTVPDISVELFVSQSANYDSGLIVQRESTSTAEVPSSLLEPVSREEALEHALVSKGRRRGKSKAAEQQLAIAEAAGRISPLENTNIVVEGINAKPTMGLDIDS